MDNIYNNFNKEQFGKIYDYDGEAGIIVTDNEEYNFSKKDIVGDYDLTKGDIVTFRINHLPFGNEVIYLAKFIKREENIRQK